MRQISKGSGQEMREEWNVGMMDADLVWRICRPERSNFWLCESTVPVTERDRYVDAAFVCDDDVLITVAVQVADGGLARRGLNRKDNSRGQQRNVS